MLLELPPPTGLHLTVDPDLAVLDPGLGLAAVLNQSGQFEQLPQSDDFTTKFDFFHTRFCLLEFF